MDTALESLDQTRDIAVVVTTYNARAVRFYEKNGFEYAGPKDDYELSEGVRMPTMLMARRPTNP